MPELPEVETFVRTLRDGRDDQPSVIGCRVKAVEVLWAKTLATPTVSEFSAEIVGQQISSISRRGKFVVIQFGTNSLLIHLRMSGDLVVLPAGNLDLPRHTRLCLYFTDGSILAFNDPRKFGRVWWVADPQEVIGGLGYEPLDPNLDAGTFYYMLRARNRYLKPLLLDQHFLAGIGNIYCDEALHLSGLHPLRGSGTITREEAARLLQAIQAVLQEGIERNGSSIDWVYRGGDFQNHFRVYGRTGQPCPVCGTSVSHLKVGQRSTHICTQCQPLED